MVVMNVLTLLIGVSQLSFCLLGVDGGAGSLAAAPGRRSRDAWPAAWKQVADHNTSELSSHREAESSGGNGSVHDNSTGPHEGGVEHEIERYKVAQFDFEYVRPYLLIGIWILFASFAKIGKLGNCQMAPDAYTNSDTLMKLQLLMIL